MTASEIFEISKNKTRIAIISHEEALARIFLSIAENQQKNCDFVLKNLHKIDGNDFIVIETENPSEGANFHPNIVMISEEIPYENFSELPSSIIQGGVLIYPENLEKQFSSSENYFRKLPFKTNFHQQKEGNFTLNTEFGLLPINSNSKVFVKNIGGLKLLCQQIGIMEEEFYEELMDL